MIKNPDEMLVCNNCGQLMPRKITYCHYILCMGLQSEYTRMFNKTE